MRFELPVLCRAKPSNRELEILGNAAVEQQTLGGVGEISKFERMGGSSCRKARLVRIITWLLDSMRFPGRRSPLPLPRITSFGAIMHWNIDYFAPQKWGLDKYVDINILRGMTTAAPIPFETTRMVRDYCLCLRVQRASRAIGRMFDDAFRPFALTNFQFSLLMMLNRPSPPTIGTLAEDLAMDRTTMTANLKVLERRGLLTVRRDHDDSRVKLVTLTSAGRSLLAKCVERWQAANDAMRTRVSANELSSLYTNLDAIAAPGP
jgi:DNA-binding MarR family transcriptional regulator